MAGIDLRSDTVTRPGAAMRAAMAAAPVGDDVYGDDPTVNRLERLAAGMLGQEAGLYTPSGTQTNLLALLAHCGRGDEYIAGQHAHAYLEEGGGAAVLGSIQPQPLDFQADGTLDLEAVAGAIKPDDFHYARTRLLCLENTQDGRVLPLDYLAGAAALARERGLALHLDGARVFNAAVKLGVPVATITGQFDSVSVCLSKGLGAPVGSVLAGSAGLIRTARRWRKVVGGGMRQAGIIAAAGIYALQHHVERLAEDHDNARRLAAGLARIEALAVDPAAARTNMLFVDLPIERVNALAAFLRTRDIIILPEAPLRLVVHLDVDAAAIDRVIDECETFFAAGA